MAQWKALIVLINGIECYGGASNKSLAVIRGPEILERFPDSRVMELDVFPRREVRLKLPTGDWICQSAVQALRELEEQATQDSARNPIIFIANNIGVALAKQILLLAFDRGNTHVLAHRTLAMLFAGYPDFNETIDRRHHENLTSQLLLDYRQRFFSETPTTSTELFNTLPRYVVDSETSAELFNTLPRVLYAVDSEFAVIETKYCPTYLPGLPLSLKSPFPELEEAFFTLDDVIGRKHTQLLLTYESFLKRGTKMASELRRPAPLRENIDSTAWVLDNPTFRQWQEAGSSPILCISGPQGSGMTILSWSIPSHLETANRKRLSDQRELYLVFDFSRCDTRLDVEQNFVTSLIHQCLVLRPQLFNITKVMCQLVLDLRSGSISSNQLWSLLRQLLSASDDHRIVVAIHQAQRADTRELNIFKRLLRLADDHIMLRRLRILVTGRAAIKTESHEPLHIDLAGSEESRAARQQALSEESRAALQPALFPKAALMRPVWDYVEEVTENPCFSNSSYSVTLSTASLLASLSQELQSISSTGQVCQLLLSNPENFDKAKEALNWVFHATRPLTVFELSAAIALSSICKGGKASELELLAGEDAIKLLEDNMTWDVRKEVQGIIGKAIKVVGPMGNVCLIRNTFRQHFECCKALFVPGFHSLITQRCLAYISRVAKHKDGSSGDVRNSSMALALLDYADLNWAEHYKLSVNPNSLLDQTATAFLLGDEGAAWFERLEINAEKILDAVDGDPLVMAAERGLTNVVKGLLRSPLVKGWNSEVALQAAIWRGDLGVFEIILPMVLPFPEPTFPRRCLNLASEYGRTELANVILSNIDKGDIDALVHAEDSPCLVAAKNGHMETLTALLDRLPGDAVLQTDSSSRTVIHWAAAWGDADALRKLGERKGVRAKMFSTDSNTSTLLHLAAAAGSVETVEFLLDVATELVEKKDGDDLTALHLAAKGGHKAVLSTLIKARADVWARSGKGKDAICALELVAAAGHLPIFSLLVDEMKSPEGENKVGDKRISDDESDDSHLNRLAKLRGHFRTSLVIATCAGHSHIVHYILRQGGEYVPTIDFSFLLDNYLMSHCLDTIKEFVEGVDLSQGTGVGLTLLASALQHERADMVRYIVNALPKEPLKNIKTRINFGRGGNILHYAAAHGYSTVMRELLQHHQANSLLKDQNHWGELPLDVAVEIGNQAVAEEILRTWSNTMASEQEQSETIFRAVQTGRVPMLRLLLDNGWKADSQFESILRMAKESEKTEMVKVLLEMNNTSL